MKITVKAEGVPDREVEQQRTASKTAQKYLEELRAEGKPWPAEVTLMWPKQLEPWKKMKQHFRINAEGVVTKRW